MKKRIKKWGDSLVIVFTKEDCELYGLVEGDVIDLDDMLIQQNEKNKEEEMILTGGRDMSPDEISDVLAKNPIMIEDIKAIGSLKWVRYGILKFKILLLIIRK